MIVKFDALNRMEQPALFLCSPSSTYDDGKLTGIIGGLAYTEAEENIFNFNAPSELNFRINLPNNDFDETGYDQSVTDVYDAIANRRLIFMPNIGYFVITHVDETKEENVQYKDVQAKSVEKELEQKEIPYIEDGTYPFLDHQGNDGLLNKLMLVIPSWTIVHVDEDVAERYRTFEDVSLEMNCYAFMIEEMQSAYECIFEFDAINRQISVYDQANYVHTTSIRISNEDVVDSLKVSEDSEDLYTAISVSGGNDLGIAPVNPTGTNTIYNFTHYLSWMSDGLRTKIEQWMSDVSDAEDNYISLNESYYEELQNNSTLKLNIEALKAQIELYQRCRDNVVASQAGEEEATEHTVDMTELYNEALEELGGEPIIVSIEDQVNDLLDSIDELIAETTATKEDAEVDLATSDVALQSLSTQIESIIDSLALTSILSVGEYDELSKYIYQGSYSDEYVIVTEIMTYPERLEQMKILYDRAKKQLERISKPKQDFTVDVESFIFEKDFREWTDQLETGCLVDVEVKKDEVASLFLSSITVNYDDKSMTLKFGSRYDKYDTESLFQDVLGSVSQSANSISYIMDQIYPIKIGEIDRLREAIINARNLSMQDALSATNQAFVIDGAGITGRKINENEESGFDDKQVKMTSNLIVFTDDAWQTCKVAIGDMGDGHYGINAETIVGNLIIGNDLILSGILRSANDTFVLNMETGELTIDPSALGGSLSEAIDEALESSGIQDQIDDIQSQIDGAIETYSGDEAPTLNNYPAEDWSADDYGAHVGDLFVGDEGSEIEGFWYRFQYNRTTQTYGWVHLRDNEIQQAIQDAHDALTGSVHSSDVEYYKSTSHDSLVGGSWNTTAPQWEAGYYIWTRTKFMTAAYDSSRPDSQQTGLFWYSTPVCITGAPGEPGRPGASSTITGTSVTYQKSDSGTVTPTGTWSSTVPALSEGDYLWTRTVVNYASGDATYSTTAYSVSYIGTNGGQGTSSYTFIKYSKYSNGVNPTTQMDEMYDSPAADRKYIGICVTDSSTKPTQASAYQWGKYLGEDGDPGNGIDNVYYYYKTTTTQDAPSPTGSGWLDYIPQLSPENKYLWQRMTTDYTDGTDSTIVSLIAVYGNTGTSISTVEEWYAVSTSNTTAPSSGWVMTNPPAMTPTNKYLWNYEVVRYSNGSTTETAKQVIGVYGTSVGTITNWYLATNETNANNLPTQDAAPWTTTVQSVDMTHRYLWNYEVVYDTAGNVLNRTGACIIGHYGMDGDDGVTISSTSVLYAVENTGSAPPEPTIIEYYQTSNSNTTAPTGTWSTTIQNPTSSKRYLWNYAVITGSYPSSVTINTTKQVIGTYASGVTYSSVDAYYLASPLTTGVTTEDGGWTTSVNDAVGAISPSNINLWRHFKIKNSSGTVVATSTPINTNVSNLSWNTTLPQVADGQYLWTKTIVTYSSGESTVAYSMAYNGIDGGEGTGISEIAYYYMVTSTASTPSASSSSWGNKNDQATAMSQFSATNKYMWRKEEITFTGETQSKVTVTLYAVHGQDGNPGTSITGVVEHFAVNNSSTTAPASGWKSPPWTSSNTMPEVSKTNRYMWNYETISYSSGAPTDTTKRIIAMYSEDGVSIGSVVNYYLATNASSNVTKGTSGWTTTVQSVDTDHKYLWNYEEVYDTNGNLISSTTPCIIGAYGDTGAAAVIQYVESSTNVIIRQTDGTLSPGSVTFSAYSKSGSGDPAYYDGKFKIYESDNGSSWGNAKYTTAGSANEHQVVYTPSVATTKYIKCELYQAGGTTVKLDQEVVGVVKDGTSSTSYKLIVSDAVIIKGNDGNFTPPSITLYSKMQTGSNPVADYSGYFKIEKQLLNGSWEIPYTTPSQSPETTHVYTIPSDAVAIRCSLYTDNQFGNMVDQETIPVIYDVSEGWNLLQYTGSLVRWVRSTVSGNEVTFTDGDTTRLINIPNGAGEWYIAQSVSTSNVPVIHPYSEIRNKQITVSFWVKASSNQSKDSTILYELDLVASPSAATRLKYHNQRINFRLTNQWQRITYTEKITDSSFTLGDTTPNWNTCYYRFILGTLSAQSSTYSTAGYQIKELKMEIGSVATAWCPAKEDTEAYTIDLSNENHTFIKGTQETVDCEVNVYKGRNRISCTLPASNDSSVGCPSGMTYTNLGDGTATTSGKFRVSVSASFNTASGVLNIPITVDGKTFTRNFSYSLAKDGEDGYTVVFTNENHTFLSGVQNSAECEVIVLKGTSRVGFSLPDSITGLPTGLSYAKNRNGTASQTGKFTITSAATMSTSNGVINITITTTEDNSRTFTKQFTYSLTTTARHILTSSSVIVKDKNGGYSPTSITVQAKSQTGVSAMTDYSGFFKIEVQASSGSWSSKYTSTSAQTTYTYPASGSSLPSDMIAIRCSLYTSTSMTTANLLDQQTIPVVSDGGDGDDGYSFWVTNSNNTFQGGVSSAMDASVTCEIYIYKGGVQQQVTAITNKTTLPTGMTFTPHVSTVSNPTASFDIGVTSAMTTLGGTLNIEITADGKKFYSVFSYSLALIGEGFTWNQMRKTEFFDGWKAAGGTPGTFDNSNGIFTFPNITSTSNTSWIEPPASVPYSNVRNKNVVFSMEYKDTAGTSRAVKMEPFVTTTEDGQYMKYRNVFLNDGTQTGLNTTRVIATGDWQKVYTAPVLINDSFFTTGNATVDFNTAYFGATISIWHASGSGETPDINLGTYQIRRPKIEVGERVTEWTPAREDLNGDPGADGTGIVSIQELYYCSSSNTNPGAPTYATEVVSGNREAEENNVITFTDASLNSEASVNVNIAIAQGGTGDASPTNIRPISSVPYIEITRAGKNLLPITATSQTVSGVTVTVDGGKIILNGTATAQIYFNIGSVTSLPAGTYYWSGMPEGSNSSTYYMTRTAATNPTYATTPYTLSSAATQTPRIYIKSGVKCDNVVFTPMITYDDPEVYTVSLPARLMAKGGSKSELFRGTFEASSGKLTVTHKVIILDGETENRKALSKGTSTSYDNFAMCKLADADLLGYTSNSWVTKAKMTSAEMLCSHAPTNGGSSLSSYDAVFTAYAQPANGGLTLNILFNTSKGLSSVALCNQWLQQQYANGTPVQMSYKLATPVVYNLSNLSVSLLEGDNNIYTNCGKISGKHSIYERWVTDCPAWSSLYRYYYTCSQMLCTDGSYKWTDPVHNSAFEQLYGLIGELTELVDTVGLDQTSAVGQIEQLQALLESHHNSGLFDKFKIDGNGVHITYDQGEIFMNGPEIQFLVNGQRRAFINADGFNFDYGILTTALTIGRNGDSTDTDGEWTWMKAQSGNFRLVYKG